MAKAAKRYYVMPTMDILNSDVSYITKKTIKNLQKSMASVIELDQPKDLSRSRIKSIAQTVNDQRESTPLSFNDFYEVTLRVLIKDYYENPAAFEKQKLKSKSKRRQKPKKTADRRMVKIMEQSDDDSLKSKMKSKSRSRKNGIANSSDSEYSDASVKTMDTEQSISVTNEPVIENVSKFNLSGKSRTQLSSSKTIVKNSKRINKSLDKKKRRIRAANQFMAMRGTISGYPTEVGQSMLSAISVANYGLLPNFEEHVVVLDSRFREPSTDSRSTSFRIRFAKSINSIGSSTRTSLGSIANVGKIKNIVMIELLELSMPMPVDTDGTIFVDIEEFMGSVYGFGGNYFARPRLAASGCGSNSRLILASGQHTDLLTRRWPVSKPLPSLSSLSITLRDIGGAELDLARPDLIAISSISTDGTNATVTTASAHDMTSNTNIIFSATNSRLLDNKQFCVQRMTSTTFCFPFSGSLAGLGANTGYVLIVGMQTILSFKILSLNEENKRDGKSIPR